MGESSSLSPASSALHFFSRVKELTADEGDGRNPFFCQGKAKQVEPRQEGCPTAAEMALAGGCGS